MPRTALGAGIASWKGPAPTTALHVEGPVTTFLLSMLLFFVGGDFFPAIFRQCSLIRPLVQVSLIKDARRKTFGKFLASVAPQRSFVSMRVFWNAELLRHSCLFLSVASFSGKESEHFFLCGTNKGLTPETTVPNAASSAVAPLRFRNLKLRNNKRY